MPKYFVNETDKTLIIIPDDYRVVDYRTKGDVVADDPEKEDEEVGEVPKKRGYSFKKHTKEKKVRLCKKCGKPGHRSDNCPNGEKEEGVATPMGEEINSPDGTFYKITDEDDIQRIWDHVDADIRDYKEIAKKIGRNPLAVRDVLMNPRP
jgi:hypothetical protein